MSRREKNLVVWICAVDSGRGRLFQGRPVPGNRFHFDSCAELANDWEEHEHGRPSPLGAKDGHRYASWGHEKEERLRRFASRFAAWLEQQVESRRIEELTLFASARFLGALRPACRPPLSSRMKEIVGDLDWMEASDLVRHSKVQALIDRARAS